MHPDKVRSILGQHHIFSFSLVQNVSLDDSDEANGDSKWFLVGSKCHLLTQICEE